MCWEPTTAVLVFITSLVEYHLFLHFMNSYLTVYSSLTRILLHLTPFVIIDVTVSDDVINAVGKQLTDKWVPFARELNMNKRDKQAVLEIRCVLIRKKIHLPILLRT